jgi:predicted DNA-binding protein YlxM (UPF0122 family)
MLEKISRVVLLKDFYGPLLTEKQQNIISMHYENDWSLSEIADDMHISRQAVYDMVKRAESLLEEYEQRLGLVEKFQRTRNRLNEATLILEMATVNQKTINQALGILKELSSML